MNFDDLNSNGMCQHRARRGDRDVCRRRRMPQRWTSMILLTLRTPRLELIAATAESTTLEMQDVAAFASALDVVPPASWPPPLHDAGSIRVMEKCGMRFVGEGTPEGDVRTVRYAISRAEFRSIPE